MRRLLTAVLALLVAAPAFAGPTLWGLGNQTNIGATGFHPAGLTAGNGSATLGIVHWTYLGNDLTLSDVQGYIDTNSSTTDSTFEVWKNNASTGSILTFTGSTSDSWEADDTPSSVTVEDTDTIALKSTRGSTTETYYGMVWEMEASPTTYFLNATGDMQVSASGSGYMAAAGGLGSTMSVTEAQTQVVMTHSGWFKGLQANQDNAGVTGDVTITLRINEADTPMTVTVGDTNGVHGVNTSTRVRFAKGDRVNYKGVGDSDISPWIDIQSVGVIVESDTDQFDIMSVGTRTYSSSTTTECGRLIGKGATSAHLTSDCTAIKRFRIPFDARIGNFRVYGAGTSNDAVIDVRVNGTATSSLANTLDSSTSWVQDVDCNTGVEVDEDDELDFIVTPNGAGFSGTIDLVALSIGPPGSNLCQPPRRAYSFVP